MRSQWNRARRAGRRALFVGLLALALPSAALAEDAARTAGVPPALRSSAVPGSMAASNFGPLFGLFDPSRLTWNNTLQFGVSSGGGYSGTAGLFTSSLGYRLADPLHLRVDVGADLNPAFGGRGTDSGVFLQGFSLDWRPTDSSIFRVIYQDLRSPLQYGGYGYGAPSHRSPWRAVGPDEPGEFVPSQN